MEKAKGKIIKGALILGIATFIAKFLGAVYRLPLTRLIGSDGLGLYQMVFPVYTVLLDFSGAGVPNALSKLISGIEQENRRVKAQKLLTACIKLFSVIGLIGLALMALLSKPFSSAQGNGNAYLAYITLAPSVFFVSLICCYRGYFQGNMKMYPTAISQIIEQTIKLILGLTFAYLFAFNISYATAGATLAITFSELVALVFLWALYKKQNRVTEKVKLQKGEFKSLIKTVIKIAVPVTLIGIIIPLSQVVDSFLALNIISGYRADATSLYGLFSGAVMSVISLPVAVCYGLASVSVPAVSGAKSLKDKLNNGKKTILITFLAGVVFAVAVYAFAPIIVNILFGNLVQYQKQITVELLKMCSPCVLFLSVLQTQNSVLIGLGKPYFAVFSLIFGVLVKIILSAILLSNVKINIYGAGLALIACYFCACLVNLLVLIVKENKNEYSLNLARRVPN